MPLTRIVQVLLVVLIAAAGACRPADERSDEASARYQDTVRAFYQGLASLDVGLLEDAEILFARAAALAPDEPAIRANLAVAQVGFGNDEAAAVELEAARTLAPDSSEIAFLQGQLAAFSARFDEAQTSFRETLTLDPGHLLARYALAQLLERADDDAARLEAQQLIEAVLDDVPDNVAVLVEHLRVAAGRADATAVAATIERLTAVSARWPAIASTQLAAASAASAAGDVAQVATRAQFLRNVLVRQPEFRKDLSEVSVSAELVAEPLRRFLRLPTPAATAAPRDDGVRYVAEPIAGSGGGAASAVAIVPPSDGPAAIVSGQAGEVRWIVDGAAASAPLPAASGAAPPAGSGLLALDWNGDYRMDLAVAGAGGLRLFTRSADGDVTEMTPATAGESPAPGLASYGVWSADTEMDGDLDIVMAPVAGAPWVLRNNADGTWLPIQPFPEVDRLRGFGWGDLDQDGDPDAVLLDAAGAIHPIENLQAGQFVTWPAPNAATALVAVALADVNADGQLDLVTLDAAGVLQRWNWTDGEWSTERIAAWASFTAGALPGAYRVIPADLDNNGALDLLVSGSAGTRVWLSDERSRLEPLETSITAEVFGVADLDADGWLDLVGVEQGRPVRLAGRGTAGYAWQQIRPRGHVAAGDQRINAYGVGGEIEVRAGLLVQKQVLTGAPVHVGLGRQTQADVTRIYWPNGVMQADFDFAADQVIVAEQRLKGSCPWLFAYDGQAMSFVTDFIWRSPLGLRINAQDTADVAQTEDRVLIRGDQLAPRDGVYDLRVTAELWETHFFDHVSLLVVDHPADTEVYVNEGFSRDPPQLQTRVTGPSRPVVGAWDDAGRDVTDLVQIRDERYVATVERGTHQGVTRDHYLEIELDPQESAADVWLLAHGWVYPTDSSINVALGQGRHAIPRGVALEARDASGQWVVIHPDLGFPAGKRKTMVVNLPRLPDGTRPGRLRLRTNLEIYWDWIGSAPRVDTAAEERRLAPDVATLSYRGYSKTELIGPRGLEIPRYELANVRPRWRDLVGYHTRFGDVRELVKTVDDRYVIMNAGDELRFRFPAPAPPPAGWRRDFVLIGDGWVKDGDFNTTHSKTVGPLPAHDRPSYDAEASAVLEHDPVYRRHADDWTTYHTRFVAPDRFLQGLGRSR